MILSFYWQKFFLFQSVYLSHFLFLLLFLGFHMVTTLLVLKLLSNYPCPSGLCEDSSHEYGFIVSHNEVHGVCRPMQYIHLQNCYPRPVFFFDASTHEYKSIVAHKKMHGVCRQMQHTLLQDGLDHSSDEIGAVIQAILNFVYSLSFKFQGANKLFLTGHQRIMLTLLLPT